MEGKVKFYNPKKGYGFVTGDDEKDYFVHATALQPDDQLYAEDMVSFDPQESDRGLQAANVKKLTPESNSTPEGNSDVSSDEPLDEAS